MVKRTGSFVIAVNAPAPGSNPHIILKIIENGTNKIGTERMFHLFLVLKVGVGIFPAVPIADASSICTNPDTLLTIFAERQDEVIDQAIGIEGVMGYSA